jgi:predicted O-methyltransferase YrrM
MCKVSGPESLPHNDVDFRRRMKRRTPQVPVHEEHTRNCIVLPDRRALLARLPAEGVAAELGVAFGEYTTTILEVNRPRVLHLVDIWDSDRYREGLAAIQSAHRASIGAGTIQVHKGLSTNVLPTFPDAYFDWIYIDTDHSYETTLAELRAAAPKIKPDGFIAGHDFCCGNVIAPWPYGVIEACHAFCAEDGWQYRFLALDPRGRNSFAISRR